MDQTEILKAEIAKTRMERVASCPKCGGTWFEVIVSTDGQNIEVYRCKCGHEIPARVN